MHIAELKQHPRNTETFRDLTGEEFEDLKASISEHGIIEPIIVNQHGVIICGHQRVRACRVLGITEVPVVVREVASDEEHETLLIEENLRRRQLTVSETARAVKRLYELRGLDGVKGGPSSSRENPATVAGLASELGKSERSIRTMRTLADLIPPLAAMLDNGEITQTVAYQLAQLDETAQKYMESWMGLKELSELEAKRMKANYMKAKAEAEVQTQKIADMEAAIADLSKKIPTTDILEQINDLQRQLLEERQKPVTTEIVEPPDYKSLKAKNRDLENKIQNLSDEIKKQREKFDKDRTTFENSVSDRLSTQIKIKEEQLNRLRKELENRSAQLDAINHSSGMVIPARELARRVERNLEDIAAGLAEFFDELGSYEIPEESAPMLRKLADRMLTGAENFNALLREHETITLEVER